MTTLKQTKPVLKTLAPLLTILCMATAPIVATAADDNTLKVTVEKKTEAYDSDIFVIPFAGDNGLSQKVMQLLNTTSLKATDQDLVSQPHTRSDLGDTLPIWQRLSVPYMVVGSTQSNRGNMVVNFEVIDIQSGMLMSSPFSVSGYNTDDIATQVADNVYRTITGKPSDFNARIAYVEELGSGPNMISKLVIQNQDGSNRVELASLTDKIIRRPAASPDGRYLAYSVQASNNHAYIYIMDLETKNVRRLVNLKGDNLSPSFSNDGTKVVFSSTVSGDADIYSISVRGGNLTRLTPMPYEQFHPSYDSKNNLVFASDHENPNKHIPSIYRYSSIGTHQRITRGNYAADPSLSPDGSMIGYLNGRSAAVMSINGQNIVNYGQTGTDQSPQFSPSGDRVVYAQGENRSTIINRLVRGGDNPITFKANGRVKSPTWVPSGR